MYPLRHPHGASASGLMTLSAMTVDKRPAGGAAHRKQPDEAGGPWTGATACTRIPVAGGGELVLYNLHLSAYTSDGTIAMEQLKLLLEDMQREYDAGNWCVAGGDFNKDLLGIPPSISGEADRSTPGRSPFRRTPSTGSTCP